jgi:hypothetical protein
MIWGITDGRVVIVQRSGVLSAAVLLLHPLRLFVHNAKSQLHSRRPSPFRTNVSFLLLVCFCFPTFEHELSSSVCMKPTHLLPRLKCCYSWGLKKDSHAFDPETRLQPKILSHQVVHSRFIQTKNQLYDSSLNPVCLHATWTTNLRDH